MVSAKGRAGEGRGGEGVEEGEWNGDLCLTSAGTRGY